MTEWDGEEPNLGSATYCVMSKHQSELSVAFSLSQYVPTVESLAKATSP